MVTSWPVCTDLNKHFCHNWETCAHMPSSLRLELCLLFVAAQLCSVWYSNKTSGGLCIALVKPLNCSNLARLFLRTIGPWWVLPEFSGVQKSNFAAQFDAKIDNISWLQARLTFAMALKNWALKDALHIDLHVCRRLALPTQFMHDNIVSLFYGKTSL